jgi:hypothetical protein
MIANSALINSQASIDQDLHAIIRELRKFNFDRAERIYREGGHSSPIAKLTIAGDGLNVDIPAGSQVVGPSLKDGEDGARGFLVADAKVGEHDIIVAYEISSVQDNYVGCQVGALTDTFTNGCFESFGDITFPDLQLNYSYSYDPTRENDNMRTLFNLNLQAKKWSGTKTFFKFMEYYGSDEYLDEIITAAFNYRETAGLLRGSMDFSVFKKKGEKGTLTKTSLS